MGDTPKTRMLFRWEHVDKALLRDMLAAVHAETGWRDADEQQRLGRLDELLVAHAEAVLGRQLDKKVLNVRPLVDLLRDTWLPSADPAVVRDFAEVMWFATSGPDKAASLDSTADQLAFLRRRNRTDTFKVNLRRAFLDAHKGPVEVAPRHSVVDEPELDREPWLLSGDGIDDPRVPYTFQEEAWRALDALADGPAGTRRAGLVVLPTGAGKTYTAVRWLLQRMAADPQLRVLWIADQQELVEQAARTFVELAAAMPTTFERRLRRIHALASTSTTLVDEANDVTVITRASVTGGKATAAARQRLGRFLAERPCVIVVDEAHHAVAPTYEALLDHAGAVAMDLVAVGLTATPWPAGDGARRLRERFPATVSDVRARELIESGVLARPVFRVVDTRESPRLTAEELAGMGVRGDLPASVLRRLDLDARNQLVVDTWLDRRDIWGKTLVFAVDIEHADRLGESFRRAGVDARGVHSGRALERAATLAWFRAQTDDCVLVSVGMLTEGVDLPDARTAFLARPTRSRVLMHQMVGRVLRGPRGGGEAIAHVVDLRDRWDDDLGVPHPWDVLGGHIDIEIDWPPRDDGSTGQRRLPRVPDELTEIPIPVDLLSELRRRYSERLGPLIADMAALTPVTLVGYYEMGDRNTPVLEHTEAGFQELVESHAGGEALQVRRPVEVFGDLPVPRPAADDVNRFVDYLKAEGAPPPFVQVRARYDTRTVAQELAAAGAMTVAQRRAWLAGRYDQTLAGVALPSFRAFCETVERELFELGEDAGPKSGRSSMGRADLENLGRSPGRRSAVLQPLPQLEPVAERDLATLLKGTCLRGRVLLVDEADLAVRLDPVPTVGWTRRPISYAHAYWAPKISGKGKGTPVIRVNRRLCAQPDQVPDAVLEFLLWHEMLHQVLPGHGHDAEFRRIEARWPDADLHDRTLDTLAEHYDLNGDL